jgi:membrane protein
MGVWRCAREFLDHFVAAFHGWQDDSAPSMGAALAFYTLFSMAPLMVLVIAIAGLVIGHDRAQALLLTQLSGLLGETGALGVKSVLSATRTSYDGFIATSASLVTLAVGATTVFAELKNDLDRIWKYRAPRDPDFWTIARARLLSFGMVVVIGFLLLVSLVVSAALSYVGGMIGGGAAAMRVLELAVSLGVTTGLFALVFKVLPSAPIMWRDVWLGSLVTAVLFWVGKYLIGLYIGRSVVASSYGAAGTLVVAIVWVYYSAQVFFFGAEFTRAYACRHGSHSLVPDAANSDFVREDEGMVERARRIVKGKDPALVPPHPRAS